MGGAKIIESGSAMPKISIGIKGRDGGDAHRHRPNREIK